MASVETLVTSLEDFFPKLKKPRTKIITLALICVMYFLKGLLLTSQAGTYWVELMDTYSANYAILIIAFAECLSVSWFFGECLTPQPFVQLIPLLHRVSYLQAHEDSSLTSRPCCPFRPKSFVSPTFSGLRPGNSSHLCF